MQTAIFVAGGIALVLGALGGATSPITPWYDDLKKPRWQPPKWLFGPAWGVILACAATAAVMGWNASTGRAARTDLLIVFAVNAVFFIGWSPLFFVARRPDWAMIEWVFLWASVAAATLVVARVSDLGGLFMAPYLAWVTFAGVLNRAVVIRNRPFAGRVAG